MGGGFFIFSSVRLKSLPFFYGWIILVLSFLTLFATFGVRSSFGAYIISWENEFAVTRTTITLISLISFFTFAISQPFVGRMNDRFGARFVLTASLILVGASLLLSSRATQPWQLIIVYGIAASVGLAGGSNVTAASVITYWFNQKRGFALGLALSGMAVGELVIVPITLYLIKHYNWHFSMSLLGWVILLVFMPLSLMLIRSKPEDLGLKAYGQEADSSDDLTELKEVSIKQDGKGSGSKERISIKSILKEKVFWQLSLPYFICGFTDVGLIGTHFIPFAEGRGFSVAVVAFAFSTIAAFNIVGTIGTGYMSDRFSRSRQLGVIYAIRGVTFLLLLTVRDSWLLIIFAVLYGLTEMASIAPTSSLCGHLFGKYSVGTVFGFVSVSHQMGGAIGSLIPGVLFDLTGSYIYILGISILLLWGSALLVSRIADPRHMRNSIVQ